MNTPEAKETNSRRLSRREFFTRVVGPAVIAGLAVACGAERNTPIADETPIPTATPSPTREIPTPTEIPPTPTQKPTEVPTETPTKTPTPEPTATPTPEVQRVVYLEDNFAGTNRAVFEGPNPRYEGDTLFFTFPESGGSLLAARRFPLSNFRLETRLSGNGAYGLVFGDFEGGVNYLLVLEKNGQLNLKKLKGEEYLGLRFNKEVTSRAGVEGFHDFGLDYNGKRLVLFFDGEKVGEVSESLPSSGKIGLFVWNQPEKNVWVGIDSLGMLLPQELIPTPTPIPPEPTETPRPPICEIPYFINRTSDRTTGFTIDNGKYTQTIYPEGISTPPHYQWFNLDIFGIYAKVTKRDGRITAIDRENQIITFDLGGGLVVKRRFTESAQVLMWAHELIRGMPATETLKKGGNFCDLEVGDAAAILDPSEAQGANPNPALSDLWGVNIVQ